MSLKRVLIATAALATALLLATAALFWLDDRSTRLPADVFQGHRESGT